MYQDKEQRQFARTLRKNMSDAEVRLWIALRFKQLRGFKFRRQAAIGRYIVDFVCFPARIVVELDGSQHGEPERKARDDERSAWLNSQGFRVLRFWNHEVIEDLDAVMEVILQALQLNTLAKPPSPTLPTEGRE